MSSDRAQWYNDGMMQRVAAALLLAALLAVAPSAQAATRVVRIENAGFRPATITIDLDDTVVWRNRTTGRSQVVAENGAFASPILRGGQSYSVTFREVGRYPYRDALDPSERGVVVVREPRPVVSLASSAPMVVFGGDVRLAGTVSNRRAGEQVTIFAQPHGAAAPVSLGAVTTSAGGAFEFVHRPTVLTSYQAHWRSVSSQTPAVQVRPRITFRRTSSRRRFVVRVSAARSYAGRWVYLQRRNQFGQWVSLRKMTLGPRSGRIFNIPRRSGRYRVFMTVNQAGPGYMASWSGTQRVRRR